MRERKATFNIRVLAAPQPPPTPFVGTTVDIRVGADDPRWGISAVTPADGFESVRIEWGDGLSDDCSGGVIHTYARAGEYRVTVSDGAEQIKFSGDAGSEFCDVFAPRIVAFRSNARKLGTFAMRFLYNAVNLVRADVGGCAVKSVSRAAFGGCAALSGTVELPNVTSLVGQNASQPFVGCANLTAILFAEANRAAVEASASYRADSTLGTGIPDICRFDVK